VHLLHNLTRLDLWTPTKMTDVVETVFVHAPNLQALALACVDFDDFDDMFQTHRDALPSLRMFKLVSLDPVTHDEQVVGLVEFLKAKTSLEGIDTDLPGLPTNAFRGLCSWMRDRDGLRIIGIDARSVVDLDELAFFAENLSRSLTALHIQLCWENLPADAPEFESLVSLS
jgi:hypothetical protein